MVPSLAAQAWRSAVRSASSDGHLVRGEDRFAEQLLQFREVADRVQGRVRQQDRVRVRAVGRGGQLLHPVPAPRRGLGGRGGTGRVGGEHLDALVLQERGEARGDPLGVRRGHRDPGGAQLPYRVDEADGGAGDGHAQRSGDGRGTGAGALQAVQETAAVAGPDDGLDPGALQLLGSGREPVRGTQRPQGVLTVGVVGTLGVVDDESDGAVEQDLHPRVVVRRETARVEETNGRHVHPSCGPAAARPPCGRVPAVIRNSPVPVQVFPHPPRSSP